MKRINKGKRLLAVALSVLLAFGGLPTAVFAEGQPCEHEHSEDCFTDELICGYDEEAETTASGSEAEHTHTQECYALDCPHERGKHGDTCGYAEAQPCEYACELCGKTDNGLEPKPGDSALVKTITSWTFVGDDNLNEGELLLQGVSMGQQADFDTVISMLPTGISAEIEGETETAQVGISGWICPEYMQDADDNWPVTGEYIFTAKLPDGYACDPLPTVKAQMGGAELYAGDTGDFIVTGDNTKYVYSADTRTLTIHDGANLTISGATTLDKIVVASGATASITLAGVNVDMDNSRDCAFDMTGATVNLTLEDGSTNTLKSSNDYAGLQVPDGAKLTIDGTGKLEASSFNCAGIGGGCGDNGGGGDSGGTVTIEGNNTVVTATSTFGAGIGGGIGGSDNGIGGNSGTVTIKGNTVVTATSEYGAGIGGGGGSGDGGNGGSGETVKVSGEGAKVTAKGRYDVGGGQSGSYSGGYGSGGSLSVTDGATLEMQNNGTNAQATYKNCTIIDQNKNSVEYGSSGHPMASPTLSLEVLPDASLTLPGSIILTAALSGVSGEPSRKKITFTGNGILTNYTDDSGVATCTITNLTPGTYTFGASFAGDGDNKRAEAAPIKNYVVSLGEQTGFTVSDPGAKTYGDDDFTLAAAGGQSLGGVSYSAPDGNGVLAVAADGKVTITGTGKVTVTATKAGDGEYNPATATLDITVAPRDIANVTVNVTGSRVYAGSQLQPAFAVSDSGIAIDTGDYINEYGPNVDAGAGAGSMKLTGQRNYTGTKTVAFDIEKRPLDGAAITLEATSYTHTGGKIKPAVTKVVVGGITVPASAFDVGYANNTAVGIATVTVTAKADSNFSGTASATFEITKFNRSSGGGESSSSGEPAATVPKERYTSAGNQIGQSVSRSDLQRLADAGKSLAIQGGTASMAFGPAALKAILAAVPATAGDITFAAVPADISAFPDTVTLIGTRPAYSFTISYKDSQGNAVPANVNFPAGSASISLDYAPADDEATGSLFMVHVDGKGAVSWLGKSIYKVDDADSVKESTLGHTGGRVRADVPHLSVYGVAYKTPVPVFTDITNHPTKSDMEFAAARGLLSGTGEGTFSPDAAMTRGMFVTALGRLAGVNPDSYQTRSFSDVKADAYYAAYVEWAAQNNIVSGTGDKLFSPDTPVTREQMAVMIADYAGQMGYSIHAPLADAAFAGKNANRFDPQGNATRAEVSAALRRFVESIIDPATAQG